MLVLPNIIVVVLSLKFYQERTKKIVANVPVPGPHQYGTPPNINMNATEMKEAFQKIQNTMSDYNNLYDKCYDFYRMIDWSDPKMAEKILIWSIGSMFGTLLVTFIIPLNYILLVSGVCGVIGNAPLVRAATKTLTPVLKDALYTHGKRTLKMIKAARRSGKKAVIDVEIFENERWWAGFYI